MLEIFLSIVKNLLDQFEHYSKKKYADNEDNVESVEEFIILTSSNYKPFSKWVQDYLLLLVQCFVNIVRRNLNLITDSEPARDYEKHILNLVDYTQIAIEKFQDETLTNRLKRLIREIYSKHQTGPIADKIKEKHRAIISSEPKEDNSNQNKGLKRKVSNRLPSSESGQMNAFRKYEVLIDMYFTSEDFELKCNQEFTLIIKELNNLGNGSYASRSSSTLDDFFRSLMTFLDPHHEHEDEEIYLMSLRIFRKYLECSGSNETQTPMAELEIDQWKELSSEIRPKQDRLVGLGLVQLICQIIKSMSPYNIIQENLLLAISLLYGGNIQAQISFMQSFSVDEESSILEKLKQILSEAFEFIRKNMRELNTLSLKLFYIKFDTNQSQRGAHENEIEDNRRLLGIRGEIERLSENHKICRYVFRFLQLLCEGHSKELQNLLRQQNVESSVSTQKSINFVSLTAGIWGSYIKFVNPACIDLGMVILDFVIESTQGPCELNQKEFYHNKIVDFSKDFMNDFSSERDFDSRGFRGEDKELPNQLITKTIRMINALLEANQEKQIYEHIGMNVDINFLIKKLHDHFLNLFRNMNLKEGSKNYSIEDFNQNIKLENFENDFSEAFEIFFFIQNIEDTTGFYKKQLKELKSTQKLAYEFFSSNSGQIEIIFQGTIQKVYFMVHPICRFFDANQKKLFLDNVKRDTPNEKITDLMTQAPMMFDRMDHMSLLRTKISFISEGSLNLVRDICLLNILVINLYIFFTFRKSIDHMSFKTVSNSFTNTFFHVLFILPSRYSAFSIYS